MSFITSITIQRPQGTTVSTGTPVQIDNISLSVIAASGGAIPQNSMTLISLFGPLDIRLSDYLIDENATSTHYRVKGTVEAFDDHIEVLIVKEVGT